MGPARQAQHAGQRLEAPGDDSGNWIGGQEGTKNAPAGGLSRHVVSKNKAGFCIVFGSSSGGARKVKAMDTMFAVGRDIDPGTTYADRADKLEELGRFALVSTA